MGSAASASALAAGAPNHEISAQIFAEYDQYNTGRLSVDDLVYVTKQHFDSLPTTQSETWIRSMIRKYDEDGTGELDECSFAAAIDGLRRC
eukprot:CAMPEP_0197655528 /NCGR_PEP_ID=MMETSP1338-20131121/39501_1 /TAXON_ID=43686 ORGANISM="Pelagodinium beii, Strain RCC1491" /NCGR_SAMPLE_ID=MMETSP1338 /ASSEMBLY_ACC=CAM_ASM_000754 /LENGTH=90 /DNA_ID=CAMNT_0043231181 /DNA_START=64 /DNA_END=336 /DNA_ORIENTATION=+